MKLSPTKTKNLIIKNDSSEIIFKNNIELKKIFFKFSNSKKFYFFKI